MASGDIRGTKTGSRMAEAFERARKNEEASAEQESNIEVGDFISELATAIKFRMKLGLSQGDWIEEPERYFTDGLVFATEEATAASVKLQITVSMDASTSMWANNLMRFAGPTFIALDRIIRKAIADLPEGSVHYAPFIFHGQALKLPAAFLNNYVGRVDWKSREDKAWESPWPNYPAYDTFTKAKELGQISQEARLTDYRLSGEDTRLAPLFQTIKDWEEKEGDTSAVRLDIVITDGVLENEQDVQQATRIQEDRNGRLRTVLLNFLPLKEWSNYQLPERCSQFAVTKDDLDRSIRTILNDAIADLFA
jgi:hypothetical protein